jgi:anti-sigma regulatory factor (Ser/Thr protein kinase)
MLLGVEPAPEPVDHTVRLRAGDALVLYTDGLTDAYAPARMLSAAELASLLESCGGLSAAGIVERLKPWAIGAPGREPRDDVAILVVRIAEPMESPPPAVSVRLESEPQAASTAREVVDRVGDALESAVLETLRLLVSELVTNSVRHGKAGGEASVDLSVEVGAERVRVDVSDDGRGFDPDERLSEAPARSRDARDLDSGWGLYLVEQLADHWGVDRGERTRVWFELERREGAAARSSRVRV